MGSKNTLKSVKRHANAALVVVKKEKRNLVIKVLGEPHK